MAKRDLKNIDMTLVTKYMIENDCNLDEAIAAVSNSQKPVKEAATKLKAMRLQAGMSQSQLAKETDLNVRTLQAYEAGNRSFDSARLDTILKVALACRCKIEDLIESEDYLELLNRYIGRG